MVFSNKRIWFHLLILLAILFIALLFYKRSFSTLQTEGFSQKEAFLVKYEDEIYDDFYANNYDLIHVPGMRVKKEIKAILDNTQANDSSVFLDVGSSTGHVVNELHELGYRAFGIDSSKAMVDHTKKRFPGALVKQADILDSSLFDKGVLTHVLCLYYSVYQFQDKVALFRNCYFWLKPGGYLVIHLVKRDSFNVHVPAMKQFAFGLPKQYGEKRDVDSILDFTQYKYKRHYEFEPDSSTVVVQETFTDKFNGNVRQNEETLYMEDISEIVNAASYAGFLPAGKIDLKDSTYDSHQFLYFFERLL